jgi:hypothetical protein
VSCLAAAASAAARMKKRFSLYFSLSQRNERGQSGVDWRQKPPCAPYLSLYSFFFLFFFYSEPVDRWLASFQMGKRAIYIQAK